MDSSITSSDLLHPGLTYRLIGRNLSDLRPMLRPYTDAVCLPDESTDTPELVICHGGDGTLLWAERDFPGIPKLAIRDRARNPKCPLHSEEELLEQFFGGSLPAHSLHRLRARLSGTSDELAGLNDIVIARKVQLGAIRLRIRQDGRMLCPQAISDGLVLCTPFGSTGYFQSITRGHFQCGLGLAYNNPTGGDSFSILDETSEIEVEVLRGPATVMADNNPRLLELGDGDTLTIRFDNDLTRIFGMEALRCPECHHLRLNEEVVKK